MKNDLDKIFMRNIMKAALVITIIVGAALFSTRNLLHLPQRFTEGYVLSSVLAVANLFFMKQFVIFFTSNAKKNLLKIIGSIIGLFATVTGLVCLVRFKIGNPISVLIGFTTILSIMLVTSVCLFKNYDKEMKEKQG